MSGPYEIVTVLDNILAILEKGIENTISIDCVTQAPDLNKSHHVDINLDSTVESQPRPQSAETKQTHNSE